MKISPRFSIAILISISLQFALLVWALHQMEKSLPENRRAPQVILVPHTVSSVMKTPEMTLGSKTKDVAQNAQVAGSRSSGLFLWQPPPVRDPNEGMNAMNFAQLAQQRESQRYAVSAGLANLAAQMRSVVTGKIVCTQKESTEIECRPKPNESVRQYLEQFLYLALEAHRLGVAENPVHLDFGEELGVSVKLLSRNVPQLKE